MKPTILFLALLSSIFSSCQPITIKGKVTNEQGEPIPNATITIKPSNHSTITDANGSFTIHNSLLTDTLIISAIGYETTEEPNNKRGLLTVILKRKYSQLDEAVVIAYGKTTRRFNTSNITTVTAADIENQPVSNPLAALQGRVPGLIITQTSGVAGSAFNIQLRGRTSLDPSLTRNDPLIIIDGVPFESGNLPANQLASAVNNPYAVSGVSPGGLSPLNSINPQDIESISVLKDADATAIYGSRGANGVILITTKKAKPGKTKFSFGMNTGFSWVTRTMDFLNTAQYLQMRHEAFANDGLVPTNANAPDFLLWDTTRYTDFKKLLIGNTANTSDMQASVSGGDANTQFMIGAGYHRETNVFSNQFADARASMQLNLFHTPLNKKWDTRLSVIYSSDNNKLLQTDLTKYLSLPPNLELYAATGKLAWQEGGVNFSSLGFANPLAEFQKKYSSLNKNLSANLLVNYYLFAGFILRASAGYNRFTTDETAITPKSAIAPENSTLAFSQFANASRINWIVEPQAEYNTTISKGKLQVLLGSTFQERNYNSTVINANNYTNDLLLYSIAAAGAVSASNSFSLYHYSAFFGRINYNWQQKYLLDLTARRDGSSRFGPGNQFSDFGAVGAAWIFSSESFIQNALPFLSFGKLRSSLGVTGNDQVGDYSYLNLWSSTSSPYQGTPGLRPSTLYNPDYEWEKDTKLETDIELGFLKDRLSANVAYYRHRSSNQLVNYRLPNQTGFASVVKNLPALVQNAGFEISLDATIINKKDFIWKSSFNITLPSNKLISFPGLAASSYGSLYVIGKSLTVLQKIKFLGVDTTTGLYRYQDYNRDGVISTPGDLQVLGNLDPKFYGGFSNSLSYKNLQLDFFFQFTKQTGTNYLSYQYNSPAGFIYNQPVLVLDRWQKPGDVTTVQRFGATAASPVFPASYLLASSNGIYSDASFIRLKNIALAYNMPSAILKKWKIVAAKFFIQSQNLLTFTKYLGADPETQNFYQLPPLKTIVFGIQFNF